MTTEITTTIHQPSNGALVRAGESTRQEFGALERRQSAEMAAVHQAAVAEAQIKARYVMALQRPSSFIEVRSKLLADCERPSFAKTAWYSKPVAGSSVEGPSIRFAEAFMRARGNMVPEVLVVHEDTDVRVMRVSLTDLESNTTLSRDIVMRKTVERKRYAGREVVAMRGDTAIIRAYDDELADKEASLISKALRQLIMRLVPGDLLDECKATVYRVRQKGASENPEKALRALVDDFEIQLRIKPAMLAEYLGHPADTATPDEILDLQNVYTAIKDGAARWADYVAAKAETAPPAPAPKAGKASVLAAAAQVTGAPAVLAEARAATPAPVPSDAVSRTEDERVSRLQAGVGGGAKKPTAAERMWAAAKAAKRGTKDVQEMAMRLFQRGPAALDDDQLGQLQSEIEHLAELAAEREPGADG